MIKSPAPLKNDKIKNNTECTGFFEVITINEEIRITTEKI